MALRFVAVSLLGLLAAGCSATPGGSHGPGCRVSGASMMREAMLKQQAQDEVAAAADASVEQPSDVRASAAPK